MMIVAGEASGDMYGARLAAVVRAHDPQASLAGVGGDEMAAAGVELVHHIRDLSVMGIWEVVKELGRLRRILRSVKDELKHRRPDGLVIIDFYRFNIELAKEAHRLGIPTVYYVPPKLWVWGRWRIQSLRNYVDRILAIFPFEEKFYRDQGMQVTYVGNPLVEILQENDVSEFRERLRLDEEDTVIGLLPGSRPAEVRRLLPPFVQAAELLSGELGGSVRFILPLAHTVSEEIIDPILGRSSAVVTVVNGRSRAVMRISDLCLVASGTATLEAFLMEVPQVVAYRASWLTYVLGKRLMNIPRISLPNILAGRDVVKEFLQDEVLPESLARTALELLGGDEEIERYRQASREVRQSLLGDQASLSAAKAVMEAFGRKDD